MRCLGMLTLLLLYHPALSAQEQGIAAQYVGDNGIENHPAVLFAENFEAGTLAEISGRFTQVQGGSGVQVVSSAGRRHARISAASGLFFKELPPGYSQVFFRYYVQYNSAGVYHHSGGYIGGYRTLDGWPHGGSGQRFFDRFFVGAEPQEGVRKFDFYAYFVDMDCAPDGSCWGNNFLEDVEPEVGVDRWACVELMIKMNDPAGSKNGELALWVDGYQVIHLGPGYPDGHYNGFGSFFPDPNDSSTFNGLQWRDESFGVNWF
ncbi:MAG: hypothetical protein HYZ27_01220, partial [Deltaproteobacteria bacterium]|nr:hypothetical protein [Deltaproteobacteria bacterium]